MGKKKRINLRDIIAYIQGNIRYKLYYTKFNWLISENVRSQINFRIRIMKKECYDRGSCVVCGCTTTALQMANKSCGKPCYPPMMNWEDWSSFRTGGVVTLKGGTWQKKKIMSKLKDGRYSVNTYLFHNDKLIHQKVTNYSVSNDYKNIKIV